MNFNPKASHSRTPKSRQLPLSDVVKSSYTQAILISNVLTNIESSKLEVCNNPSIDLARICHVLVNDNHEP